METKTEAAPVTQPPYRTDVPISANFVSRLFVLLDSLMILASGFLLYRQLITGVSSAEEYLAAISFVWLTTIMLFHFTGLYQFEAIMRPLSVADKIVISFLTAFLFLFAIAFSLKVSAIFSRVWIASFAAASLSSTLLLRLLASVIVTKLTDRQLFTRKIAIAGGGEQASRLISHLRAAQPRFLSVIGIFTDDEDGTAHDGRLPVLGRMDHLLAYARAQRIDDVVIALPWSAEQQLLELVAKLRELPVNIYLGSDLVGFHLTYREPPSHFSGLPVLEVIGRPLSGWDIMIKAVEDYTLSVAAIVVLLPLFALTAVAIKLDSPGPILFRQKRLGFNNREFNIYKFRTMHHQPAPSPKTAQAQRNDPRVTRLGRYLRRSSIDELPQLLNVLNGSMSLVGPRPHAVDHNEEFAKQIRGYFARHKVKPGITGWAQVKGFRGETPTMDKMEARVSHDVYYTENWSLLFDLQILMRTIVICLTGRNAY